jgi:hypothetical protein
MLKWTLEKLGVNVCPGFNWLRALTSESFVNTMVNFKLYNSWEFFDELSK